MALQVSETSRNAMVSAIVALIDAGAPNGTLELFATSLPAAPESGDNGTEIGELNFSATAYGAASNGLVTNNAITSDTSTGTGSCLHFRIKDADGPTVIMQGSVTNSGAGGDLRFDNADFTTGGTAQVDNLRIIVPE